MKVVIYVWLLGISILCAGIPSLSVVKDGRRQNVEVQGVEVEVRIEGGFAETRVTMDFFNATKLRQEGEFVLPLPEGATVSDYALEVNGKMREATVVEKERAVRAYEEIKAQNIDPGIVTREAGNVYRTKIFPVEPKKVKRVMVGYVEEMKMVDGKFVYSLPMSLKEGLVKVSVFGENLEVAGPRGLKMKERATGIIGQAKDTVIDGELKVRIGSADFAKLVNVGYEQFVHFSGDVPERALKARAEKPDTLRLVWDGSASGYSRNLEKEFAVLDAFFREVKDMKVSVDVIDLEIRSTADINVRAGDWSAVRKLLETVEYDGVVDWGKLKWNTFSEDRVVVMSSGQVVLPMGKTKCRSVVHVINSLNGVTVDPVLRELCVQSGGRVMNVFDSAADALARELIELKLRVLKVNGCESAFAWWNEDKLRLIGKRADNEVGMSVVYALGSEVVLEERVHAEEETSVGGNVLRRIWAQRELTRIEGVEKKHRILDFCKEYHLVGDLTAMIVLERFSDHVKYEIPPPEIDLLEKYEKALKNKSRRHVLNQNDPFEDPFADVSVQPDLEGVDFSWSARLRWYQKDYPWMEALLIPQYTVFKKWTDAQASVFTKEQLALTNRDKFLDWIEGVDTLSEEKRELKTMEEFLIWKKSFDKLKLSGESLTKESVVYPNGEFGVSIRGLVVNPKTMSVKKGAGLKQLLKDSGGTHHLGSLNRVAIYRNGSRAVYNLESEKYSEVMLRPGDMVVVEPYYYAGGGGWNDPFSDPFAGDTRDPSKEPAIVEESYKPRMNRALLSPIGGGGGGGSEGGNSLPMHGEINIVREVVDLGIDSLDVEQDLWEAYLEVRGKNLGREIFIGVAGKLYEKGQEIRARRVLSNLFVGVKGLDEAGVREAMYRAYLSNDEEFSVALVDLLGKSNKRAASWGYESWLINKVKDEKSFSDWVYRSFHQLNKKDVYSMGMLMMEMIRLQLNFTRDSMDYWGITRLGKGCFPTDIRLVVLSSDHIGASFMSVTDPAGVVVRGNEVGLTGGWSRCDGGLAEFMVRKAIPGKYQIKLQAKGCYLVQVWTNWGREGEKKQVYVVKGSEGANLGMVSGGEIEFTIGK